MSYAPCSFIQISWCSGADNINPSTLRLLRLFVARAFRQRSLGADVVSRLFSQLLCVDRVTNSPFYRIYLFPVQSDLVVLELT